MDSILRRSVTRINAVPVRFKRTLYNQIDWNDRLISITGPRGTGKTTLMLQYIREHLPKDRSVLYASLDDIYFADNRLTDVAEDFTNMGGKYLFLDEVHKYADWSKEIKNIYDTYQDLHIVFSGSSLLSIYEGQADLSRRVSGYRMPVLSLREFIAISKHIDLPVQGIADIFENHLIVSTELVQRIKPLVELDKYLTSGAYPFFLESETRYMDRLRQTVNQVIENDLPTLLQTNFEHLRKIKRLLYVISTSAPLKPNISKISERIGADRRSVTNYLELLERSGIISMLYHQSKGMAALSKPEKIYLENPNLIHALGEGSPNTGNIRETYILNQLKYQYKVTYNDQGDFYISDQYTLEVGGKSKSRKQISRLQDAYIASDGIETGTEGRIPLWLFGFLY